MKLYSLLVLTLSLTFSPSSHAVGWPWTPEQHHLVATGKKTLADVAPIYSCLAYQGCNMTTYTLGNQNRLHIYTDKTIREINEDLGRCDLRMVNALSLNEINEDNTSTAILIPPQAAILANKISLAPAILSPKTSTAIAELTARLGKEELLTVGRDDIIETLGIENTGYTTTLTEDKTFGGLTDHQAKTVKIAIVWSDGTRLPPHRIIDVVRHEFDHVRQVKQSDQCPNYGLDSTFGDHVRRERAAYLDDLVFYQYVHESFWYGWTMDTLRKQYLKH